MASRRGRASSRRPASTESNARATGSVGRSVRLHIFIHTFISLLRTARRPRARARTPRVAARRRRLTRSHPHPSRSTDASIAPPSLEPPTPSGGRGLEPARIIESSVIHHRVTPPRVTPSVLAVDQSRDRNERFSLDPPFGRAVGRTHRVSSPDRRGRENHPSKTNRDVVSRALAHRAPDGSTCVYSMYRV